MKYVYILGLDRGAIKDEDGKLVHLIEFKADQIAFTDPSGVHLGMFFQGPQQCPILEGETLEKYPFEQLAEKLRVESIAYMALGWFGRMAKEEEYSREQRARMAGMVEESLADRDVYWKFREKLALVVRAGAKLPRETFGLPIVSQFSRR